MRAFVIASLALTLVCDVAGSDLQHQRSRHIHRALQPLTFQSHAGAGASADGGLGLGLGVSWTNQQIAEGVEIDANQAYSYPAKDHQSVGVVPATQLCRDALDAVVGIMTANVKKDGRWPMAGVLIDSGKQVVVIALSGWKPTDYSAQVAATFQNSVKAGVPALAGYTIVDLNDGKGLGYTERFLNAVGVAMNAYTSNDKEFTLNLNSGLEFKALGALQGGPNKRKLSSKDGETGSDVWSYRDYGDSKKSEWSKRVCAANTYKGLNDQEIYLAIGNPFGRCAGSKLAAYAQMAELTPACMAERLADPNKPKLRASCLTCQHVVAEMLAVPASSARTSFLSARRKVQTRAVEEAKAAKEKYDKLLQNDPEKKLHDAEQNVDKSLTEQQADWWVKSYTALQEYVKHNKKKLYCEEQAKELYTYLSTGKGKIVSHMSIDKTCKKNDDTLLTATEVGDKLKEFTDKHDAITKLPALQEAVKELHDAGLQLKLALTRRDDIQKELNTLDRK